MTLSILYRDHALVAIDKPSGLAVHRGWAGDRDVAMTRVRDHVGAHVYPVHRLDRGASGVLVFALDPATARSLHEQLSAGGARKRYLALVRGVPPERATIDHPIPRRPGGPRVPAVTDIERLEVFGRYSLVAAYPRTGRLHQIRRHLKHISCPIIGDVNYGKGDHNRLFRAAGLQRLALHAHRLTLTTPSLTLEAPLPTDLTTILQKLTSGWRPPPPTPKNQTTPEGDGAA